MKKIIKTFAMIGLVIALFLILKGIFDLILVFLN